MQTPEKKRKVARGHTIVPFPKLVRASELKRTRLIKQVEGKARKVKVPTFGELTPEGGRSLADASVKRLSKLCAKALEHVGVGNVRNPQEVIEEIRRLFSFLPEDKHEPIDDVVSLFRHKMQEGEIKTAHDIKLFLRKAEDLADCLRLYLERNEFCRNFMTEVSLDIFECGFPAKNGKDSAKYFS